MRQYSVQAKCLQHSGLGCSKLRTGEWRRGEMKPEPCRSQSLLHPDPQRPLPSVMWCRLPRSSGYVTRKLLSPCSQQWSQVKLAGRTWENQQDWPGVSATLPDPWRREWAGVRVRMPRKYFWWQAGRQRRAALLVALAAAVSLGLRKPRLLCIRCGFASKITSMQVLCRPSEGTWYSEQIAISHIGSVCHWNPRLVSLKLILVLFTSFS